MYVAIGKNNLYCKNNWTYNMHNGGLVDYQIGLGLLRI